MAQPGKIALELSLILDQFNQAIVQANGKLTGLGKDFDKMAANMQKAADNFTSAGEKITKFVTAPILALAAAATKSYASMEQQQVAFTTMLGSAEKAKNLLQELETFSASTPFQLPEVVDAGRKLLSFGFSAQSIIPTLKMVGDVAAGTSIPIGDLANIFGKARVSGQVMNDDLRQLAERGFPVYEQLGKVLQVPAGAIRKMAEEGQINFNNLQKAFQNVTREGGMFGGMMDKQSKTLSGAFSNILDNVGMLGRQLLEGFIPTLKEIEEKIMAWTEALRNASPETKSMIANIALTIAAIGPAIFIIGKLIAAYEAYLIVSGAVRAALAGEALATGAGIVTKLAYIVTTKAAAAAMLIFNAITAANPIMLLVTATAAAISAFAYFKLSTKESTESVSTFYTELSRVPVQKIVEGFKEAQRQQLEDQKVFNQKYADEKKKAQDSLLDYLGKTNKSETQIIEFEAAKRLGALYEQNRKGYISDFEYNTARIELEKETTRKLAEENLKRTQQYMDAASQIGSAMMNLYSAIGQSRQRDIEEKFSQLTEDEQRYANYQEQQEISKYSKMSTAEKKEYDLKKAADAAQIKRESEKNKALNKLAREQAIVQKVTSLFQIAADTARGIMSAIATFWLTGGQPWATIIGIAGGLQAAAVLATPLPKAASGGFADSPSIFGEAGPELAIPLSAPKAQSAINAFANAVYSVIDSRGVNASQSKMATISPIQEKASGSLFHVQVFLGSEKLYDDITRASDDGLIRINPRAVRG